MTSSDGRAPHATPAAAASLRLVHAGMIDAVLAGAGVARVAALAAAELAGAVAIVLPAVDVAVVQPGPLPGATLRGLRHYVGERLQGHAADPPDGLVAEIPVHLLGERLGSVLLVDAERGPQVEEVLELAALAALTAVTLEHGATLTQRRARADLLEELRGDAPPAPNELIARARRLGSDLSDGAAAVCARPPAGATERALATIAEEFPSAVAAVCDDRVEALLPAPADERGRADEAARRLVRRLRQRGPAGLSPFEPDVTQLPHALATAELAMMLGDRAGIDVEELLDGSWALLLRVATRDAGQLDALVASSVAPALEHGHPSQAALLDTLHVYLDQGANMTATARALYLHRHTVSYHLERIHELTGHDPLTPRGQEQLALGLKALAIRNAAPDRSR